MIESRLNLKSEYKNLKRVFAGGSYSHAYLLISEDASLLNVAEAELAAAVVGSGEERIALREHPDVLYYNIEGKMKTSEKDGGEDSAERLIEDAYIKPLEGKRKVIFLERAGELSAIIQNKLLKIIEDPPKGLVFFLVASGEAGILKTIVSRVKKLYLPRFSSSEVFSELRERGVPDELAKKAAAVSGGRFDRAFEFSEGTAEDFSRAVETLCGCKKSSDVVNYIGDPLFEKESAGRAFSFIAIILGDMLEYVSGGKNFKALGYESDIAAASEGFSAAGLAEAILFVALAEQNLFFNVSSRSAAETLLFNILEAKHKWRSS
jgi:DNA polymerase III, gamma/tau subunits